MLGFRLIETQSVGGDGKGMKERAEQPRETFLGNPGRELASGEIFLFVSAVTV
jgi:hypothetical protein